MADREYTPEEAALLDLLKELAGLSSDTDNDGRILILGPDGRFVGDVALSLWDIVTATKALAAAKAFTDAQPDLDPVVEQDLEEQFIGLDAEYLMDLAAQDPAKAIAEFDEITTPIEGDQA